QSAQSAQTAAAAGGARFFGRRVALQSPAEALHPETPPPPPSKPPSQRRPMLSAFSGFLSFLMIAALFGLGGLSYLSSRLATPGPLENDRVIYIAPRTEVVEIIEQLAKAKVIDQPTLMKGTLMVERKWNRVRSGEYLFKKQASLNDVIETLVAGRQVMHSITIPEGLTSEQIVERLRANEVLAGDIRDIPAEGSLLPETYRVPRGMSRSALLRKMQEDQTRLLDRLWAKRSSELPLRSRFELVTMASIVEKETGRSDERTRVAGVFYNRLRRGMRLQSDPTIVYGLVGGKGTLGRPIQRDEIRRPTAYNTYVIPALPPGPIANPGRASLEAAINPSRTNDLFFVANGAGGHTFAETLEQHNRNVARWRVIEKEMRAKAGAGAPGAAAPVDVDRVADPDASSAEPAAPAPRNNRRGDLPSGSLFGGLPEQFGSGTTSLGNLAQSLAARRVVAALPPAAQAAIASAKPSISTSPSTSTSLPPASTPAPQAAAGAAPAQAPAAPSTASSPFKISPGIGEFGIEIAGIGNLNPGSPVDGPIDASADDAPPSTGGVESFP
ncbi:MAG: endolytic transglycosylase MltG, partial [Alphaproteobacteria bacterium]|nr:endolytic transglycosylase MltG [Alphaproteobacteria bacterium]